MSRKENLFLRILSILYSKRIRLLTPSWKTMQAISGLPAGAVLPKPVATEPATQYSLLKMDCMTGRTGGWQRINGAISGLAIMKGYTITTGLANVYCALR